MPPPPGRRPPAETLPFSEDPPWASAGVASSPAPSEPRYRVLRELARGGIGRVLEAHDAELDRAVAIKELLHDSPGGRARFEREIRFTARLQHPAIVPLYEAIHEPDGSLRYAMKLVTGQTLQDAIDRAPDLEARLGLLRHVEAVADALAYAHAQGVIHRDVKPQNVLIGPFGETVLIDWGIARLLGGGETDTDDGMPGEAPADSALTQLGSIVGTPAYMAPEQARGESVGREVDVHALGATLYHLLSGRSPWQTDTASTLTALLAGKRPPPLSRVEPGLPADLVSIVERAMAARPQDRYPSALELSRDLQAFRTGQLVAARRYTTLDLMLRWLRRHRALVALTSVAGLLLTLMGSLSARRVLSERDLARAAQAVAEARTDALVLAQARRALAQDPTEAAAWLASWPSDGEDGAERFALAQELGGGAVARLVVRYHPDACNAIAWSTDGQQLLPLGRETGPLDATMGLPQHSVQVAWGEQVLALPDGSSAWLETNGQIRMIRTGQEPVTIPGVPEKPVAAALAGEDRAVVATRSGQIWEVPLSGDPAVQLADLDGPAYSLIQQGRRWIAATPKGELWSGALGSSDATRLLSHTAAIHSLIQGPDDALLFGDAEGGVYTWQQGQPPHLLSRLGGAVSTLALSSDATWLAAAGGARQLRVLDLRRGSDEVRPLDPPWPASRVIGLRWSPTDELLAANLADGSLRLWWPGRGQVEQRLATIATHAAPAFSPNGQELANCGVDGSIRVWPVPAAGAELHAGAEGRIFHVQALPDGRFATDGDDRTVRLWTPGRAEGMALRGHLDRAYGLDASADGSVLVSASLDGLAIAWDTTTGEGTPLVGHQGRVQRAVVLPGGIGYATAGQDGTLRTWSPQGEETGRVKAHDGAAWWLLAEESGRALWSVGGDRRLVRWEPGAGEPVEVAAELGERGGKTLRPYRLSGERILVCNGRDGLALFGPHGRRDFALAVDPHCPSMAVAPSGDWVAILSGNGVHRFDPSDGTTRLLAHQEVDIHAIAISPDGRLLATAGIDGTARIWRVDDGAAAILWRAEGPVLGLSFSPDGRRLAAAGVDALLWIGEVDEHRLAPAEPQALHAWIANLTRQRMTEALPGSAPP